MEREKDARRTAMLPEEAARMPARARGRGMGEAALKTVRRQMDALARMRVSEPQGMGEREARNDATAEAPGQHTKPSGNPRAALRHALRR